MEASENNNGADGSDNKEESSYNEAVKIFVESNDADQVMPPLVLPSPLSEQFSFTVLFPNKSHPAALIAQKLKDTH